MNILRLYKASLVIFTVIMTVIIYATVSYAASLAWDYDEYHEVTDGFTAIYSDGTDTFYKSFPVEDVIIDGETVKYDDFERHLNLSPGVEYTINLERYNDTDRSGVEGQTPVVYTREAYEPPFDQLPDALPAPSGVGNLRLGAE